MLQQMYFKDFDSWNTVKKRVHNDDRTVHIRKAEIRWVSFGVNVGSEMDGKGVSFARPALILHVIGSHLALIVPISSKTKDVPGYLPFEWKNKNNALCIHQMRVISQKRILGRVGKIPLNRLIEYKALVSKFFSL